jgi:hypothetical protein
MNTEQPLNVDLAAPQDEHASRASDEALSALAQAASTVQEALMVRYELGNPSDPYTFEAPSLLVASFVTLALGHGMYFAKPLCGDGPGVPPMAFKTTQARDAWAHDHFGCSFEVSIERADQDDAMLAAAFESVKLGRESRSSMNDIGRRAQEFAEDIRARSTEAAA